MNKAEIVSCTEQALQIAHHLKEMVEQARSLEPRQPPPIALPKAQAGRETDLSSSVPVFTAVLVLAQISDLRRKFDQIPAQCEAMRVHRHSRRELMTLSGAMEEVSRAAGELETELSLDQSLFDFIRKLESARSADAEAQLIMQVIFLFAGDHARHMKNTGLSVSIAILSELKNSKIAKPGRLKQASKSRRRTNPGNGRRHKLAA